MRTAVVICVITASAFIGPPVRAYLHELDQYTGFPNSEAVPNYGYAVGDGTMMAQTFTVGLRGTLCHVEIGNTTGVRWGDFLNDPPPPPARPVVQIWSTTPDGQPGSSLGSVTLDDPVPIEGWTPLVDFTQYNIQVEPGQMYSIVLSALNSTGAVSVGATADETYAYPLSGGPDYSGGDLWTYDAGTWLNDTHLYDMQFRTYVVPVPLPAGVWLGIFAVSVAGWHLKRQRA